MLNTRIAKVSIAGKSQFKTLQYEMLLIKLDITHVNKAIIYFGSRILLNSISIIQVDIQVGAANFYIIDTSTPFFFI